VQLASPRLHRCVCQADKGAATVSPLRDLLPGHVTPERLYLEARWASLVPYAAAADLLTDVLPVASGANATTLRQHVLQVAEWAEGELGKEQSSFIDGCPAEWAELPIPEGRIVVGLDGGYVGVEGPRLRKRTVRKENTDKIPVISTQKRRFHSDAGTDCPLIACNHRMQEGMAAISPLRSAYCTQQTEGLTRGMTLRAIPASRPNSSRPGLAGSGVCCNAHLDP